MSEELLSQTEYKVELDLASGASLDMLIFNHAEHRWIFRHTYEHPAERKRLEKPTLVNKTVLTVDYVDGVSQECNLTMDMVRPERRGKKFFVGIDISEGSRLYAEFTYEKEEGLYRLKEADFGRHGRVDLTSSEEGLVKSVEFPFPIMDRVELKNGVYRIPFLTTGDEEDFFEFPESYLKRS